jgi:subtilisin family serine protease
MSKQQERVEGMREWARNQPGDGTKLAVTSTGMNALDAANQSMGESLQGALDHPRGEAAKMWKGARVDPKKVKQDEEGSLYSDNHKTQQALDKFRDSLAEDLQQKISSSAAVKAEQAKLEKSLKDGREQDKLLVFKSAGNGEEDGKAMGDPKIGRDFDNAKGFLTVAAIERKNGKDTIAPFSSSGNDDGIAAPGANMPVGVKPNGSLSPQDGTSFAAPYAMGVAGLMSKANPKLTPDQIESVMKETARDVIPGRTLDGYGAVDVVKAVQRAKELTP